MHPPRTLALAATAVLGMSAVGVGAASIPGAQGVQGVQSVQGVPEVPDVPGSASASPRLAHRASTSCRTPSVRKEWRNMTSYEQNAYLQAESCLFNSGSQTSFRRVTNRFEDLVALHQNLTDYVHNDGVFLPWHRYFLHIHERLLRDECGYTGPMAWWDERSDAGNFKNASIFSPDTFGSLGGNPSDNSDNYQDVSKYICVTDGYFANTTLHVGYGAGDMDHCLARYYDEGYSQGTSAEDVERVLNVGDYQNFYTDLFAGPHSKGHAAVGGVMGDVHGSPGDPIFYMHHAFIDRIWWQWQTADREKRLYSVSGPTTESEPSSGWKETSLDFVLTSHGILADTAVKDVMDIEGGYLCYTFDY